MGKRTAYIGISYPLLYDYRHQANKSPNDLSDSPNPIIESPLGLMIFYDEIVFLCKSVCPSNMRNLPYIKFVDELYPDFYFGDILEHSRTAKSSIRVNSNLTYWDIIRRLNLKNWDGIDTHTHAFKLGDSTLSANSDEYNFLFDLYVFQALQNLYDPNIELIANSKYTLETFNGGAKAELIDRIIIPDIPNYISAAGPYHSCIEELRENQYIKDFRSWVIANHDHIQRSEIDEACDAVRKNIEEVKDKTFKKYLEDNSSFSLFKSTSSTILKTAAGIFCTPISVLDAFAGCVSGSQEALAAKSVRWQGFIMDSKHIVKKLH